MDLIVLRMSKNLLKMERRGKNLGEGGRGALQEDFLKFEFSDLFSEIHKDFLLFPHLKILW